MFKIVLRVVGAIQIALGLAYLFIPGLLLKIMSHSAAPPDLLYPLGMLAARFIAYGAGLWIASRDPARHMLWIRLMALVQAIDFGVGAYYTVLGVVPLSLSGPPLFNAVWIGLALGLMHPRKEA